MSDMNVYVCKECVPGWGIEVEWMLVQKLCCVCTNFHTSDRVTCRNYSQSDVFYMDKCVKQLELNTALLEAKIKLLENHIKFAPGGEGALQALYSFTEHLQKGSINAERPVSEHTQEE